MKLHKDNYENRVEKHEKQEGINKGKIDNNKSDSINLECSLTFALKIIGRKWMTFIFSELYVTDELYFTDLLNNIHDDIGNQISAKVLSSSLSVLEEYSLIRREVDKTSRPVRVKYSLTEMGEDLYIVFGALKGWARKWCRQQNKCCRYSNLVHSGFPFLPVEKTKDILQWEETSKDVEAIDPALT
ncbi:MAG: winged helix-turn-helix transcriptional regulator [Candidatus Hodarchaeales archaeon]